MLNISFSLFALASAFYAFGYGFELMSTELESMLFWSRIQYIGIPFQPGLFLIFTLSYTGNEKRVAAPRNFIFMVIPLLTFFMRWTNRYHNLYYINPSVINSPEGTLLGFEPGFFYFIHITYLLTAIVFCSFLFIRYFIKTNSYYRKQTIFIISALVIQWTALVIYLAGAGPEGFDINPFVFTVSSLLLSFGIYRYSLFNIVPVARSLVFDNMDDAVVVVDTDLRLVDVNMRVKELFGLVVKEQIGETVNCVFSDYPGILDAFSSAEGAGGEIALDVGGDIMYFKLTLQELSGAKARKIGSILTFHDISEQKKLMKDLQKLAALDSLTGIMNRRQIEIQAGIEIKRASRTGNPLSVLMLDIDNFKTINDTWGHQSGDLVLQDFAARITENIREIDHFGRYGGEEFLLIMPDTDLNTASAVAERLRSAVESMVVRTVKQDISITLSIGITGSEAAPAGAIENDTIDMLINRADEALYSAKQSGRNRVVVIYK